MVEGFGLACAYGRTNVVDFLLDQGMEVDAELRGHGEGHTGLHVAAFHGQIDVVKTLLRHGARVDSIDKTWGTPPLVWALTGWDRHPLGQGEKYTKLSRDWLLRAPTSHQIYWSGIKRKRIPKCCQR